MSSFSLLKTRIVRGFLFGAAHFLTGDLFDACLVVSLQSCTMMPDFAALGRIAVDKVLELVIKPFIIQAVFWYQKWERMSSMQVPSDRSSYKIASKVELGVAQLEVTRLVVDIFQLCKEPFFRRFPLTGEVRGQGCLQPST